MKQSVLSLVAVIGLALPAFAQDTGKPATKPATPAAPAHKQPEAKPAAAQPGQDASMEAWAKVANPGDNHKILATLAGTWTAKCKFWMGGPEAPATESTGTSTNTSVLGGRFIRMDFKGQFMESPFEGLGYLGFDNVDQKFVGSWMDTMTTSMATTSGKYDAVKKSITMTGQFKDPATGQMVNNREVHTIVDNNTLKFEMFHAGADGKEVKVGEINYTRSGAAPATPEKSKPNTAPSR